MGSSRFPKLTSQYQRVENETLEDAERDRKLKITLSFKGTGLKTDHFYGQ
jgi:hypothetical protein